MMRWLAYSNSSFNITRRVVSQKHQMLYQVPTFLNCGFVSYSEENHCKILSSVGVKGTFVPFFLLHLYLLASREERILTVHQNRL